MDQTTNTGSNLNLGSLNLSQDSIIGTLVKFEQAISGLTSTVEQTRHNIEHVIDLSMKSKEELKHIKDQVMPYVTTARNASQVVATKVRANPRPIAFTVFGLVGALFVWGYFQNKSLTASAPAVH